jgi:hypothetical protein
MIKIFTFSKILAKELLNELSEGFCKSHPRFTTFLESLSNDSSQLKIADTSFDRKQSKGHKKIVDLYKELFPNHRIEENVSLPNFEIGHKKTNVEFDVVNFAQHVIIEIDGEHHRKYVPYFHKNMNSFIEQRKRDKEKEDWAQKNGWTLIRITDVDAKRFINKVQLEEILKGAL